MNCQTCGHTCSLECMCKEIDSTIYFVRRAIGPDADKKHILKRVVTRLKGKCSPATVL